MSILSDGLTDWFRRNNVSTEREEGSSRSVQGATTGGNLDQEPVVVWRASNQMEAQVVKGRLASEGIPAIIKGEALGAIYGLTSGSLAETLVLVPALLAEKAENILYGDEAEPLVDEGAMDDTNNEQ